MIQWTRTQPTGYQTVYTEPTGQFRIYGVAVSDDTSNKRWKAERRSFGTWRGVGTPWRRTAKLAMSDVDRLPKES